MVSDQLPYRISLSAETRTERPPDEQDDPVTVATLNRLNRVTSRTLPLAHSSGHGWQLIAIRLLTSSPSSRLLFSSVLVGLINRMNPIDAKLLTTKVKGDERFNR